MGKYYDPRKDDTNGDKGLHRLSDPETWEEIDNVALVSANLFVGMAKDEGIPLTKNFWPNIIWCANYCDEPVEVKSIGNPLA